MSAFVPSPGDPPFHECGVWFEGHFYPLFCERHRFRWVREKDCCPFCAAEADNAPLVSSKGVTTMGWWKTDESGRSMVDDGALTWGDGPADAMDGIIDAFVSCVGRMPTEAEILAGFKFSSPKKNAKSRRRH